jgi:hypothetical protein
LADDIFLKYSVCVVITYVMFILNPFIVFAANNQNVSDIAIHINNSYDRPAAQMENYDSYSSYIHYVDVFSDLSRNMTSSSSSDLIENDASIEAIEEDNINSNTEDETTVDTNQSSSSSLSSSSSDLSEDNTIPTEEIEEEDTISTEADSEDETTVDTNQPSSSSSP